MRNRSGSYRFPPRRAPAAFAVIAVIAVVETSPSDPSIHAPEQQQDSGCGCGTVGSGGVAGVIAVTPSGTGRTGLGGSG